MSKLSDMIESLCPDGVEYVRLGEVAEVGTGKSNKQDAVKDGQYPFYVRSKNIERIDTYEFDEEAVIIPGEGGIGEIFHYVNGKYALHQRAYRIHFLKDEINTKFAYYYFSNFFKRHISMKAVIATVTSIRKPMIENFEIPLPPLPIQQEIVRILDTFTQLQTELQDALQKEYELRKKQYNYYREHLLTFGEEVERKRLGEIGTFFGGLSGKNRNDFKEGNAKYITYMNVYQNLSVNLDIEDFVSVGENEKQNAIQYGDVLFTTSSETPDECGMSSVVNKQVNEKIYLNSFCFGFRLNDVNLYNPDFLKHLFRSLNLRSQIRKTAAGVTRFNVSKKKFENIQIPLPPLEKQREIASILDKFSALTTSLTEGIPAEIELRRKQYNFYREKLLTFRHKQ